MGYLKGIKEKMFGPPEDPIVREKRKLKETEERSTKELEEIQLREKQSKERQKVTQAKIKLNKQEQAEKEAEEKLKEAKSGESIGAQIGGIVRAVKKEAGSLKVTKAKPKRRRLTGRSRHTTATRTVRRSPKRTLKSKKRGRVFHTRVGKKKVISRHKLR